MAAPLNSQGGKSHESLAGLKHWGQQLLADRSFCSFEGKWLKMQRSSPTSLAQVHWWVSLQWVPMGVLVGLNGFPFYRLRVERITAAHWVALHRCIAHCIVLHSALHSALVFSAVRSEIPDAQTLHVAPSHLPSPPTHHYIAHSRDSNTLHWLKIPSISSNNFKVWPRMPFKAKSLRRSILRCHYHNG